jgi:hypothetical protein
MKNQKQEGCGKVASEKECLLSDLNLPTSHEPVLHILRHYFNGFAVPQSMSGITAFTTTNVAYDEIYGPQVAVKTLQMLQDIRLSRRSPFNFNSPACPNCRRIITEHERRVLLVLKAINASLFGQARTELMMLFEGNDIDQALRAVMDLNRVIRSYAAQASPLHAEHIA